MEQFLIEIVTLYAPQVMEAVLYVVVSLLALAAAKYLKPILQNKVIKAIAKNVVLFVEQTYKDLHGEDKLNKALEAFSEMLAERKIKVSANEMRVMLEAAVAELNGVFAGLTK
jgi:hypothetical protein